MAEKLPSLHKTLLILLVVFIPPFWLLFTDDGMRVSDSAVLWLFGRDEIELNIGKLDRSFSREDIQTVFSENEWRCGDKDTSFGNHVCATGVGTFNGYPAHLLTFYFQDQNVNAVKLIYHDQYHQQLLGYFIQQFGQPANVEKAIADGPDADTVLHWKLDGGALVMSKELGEGVEPSFMWLAAEPATP